MGLRNRTQLTDQDCFFVTTTCYKWLRIIDSPEAVNIVTDSLNFLINKYSCHILAYVIMPNHLHFIILFPKENRLSDFMRDFKKFTSVQLRKLLEASGKTALLELIRFEQREQKLKVWMSRFDDFYITSKETFFTKLNYIHNNPLQAHWQLADLPENYAYSSAAYYEGRDAGKLTLTHYSEFIW